MLLRSSFFISYFLFFIFFVEQGGESDLPNQNYTSNKIVLDQSMILNETVYGDATKLIDEQSKVGNPATGDNERPESTWNISYNRKDFLPFSAVIDLGKYYSVTQIYIYDAEGKGELVISTGEPFQWKEKVVEKLDNYKKWKSHNLEDTTRFLQIKLNEMVSTPEIVLYGTPVNKTEYIKKNIIADKKRSVRHAYTTSTMDELVGVNAFIDDPIENIKAVNFVREYHSWSWDEGVNDTYKEYPDNEKAWAPSHAGGGAWNFDKYYKTLRDADINVVPCIQGSVDWITKGHVAKPVSENNDPLSPASYIAHADHLFQFAARYGSNKVDDAFLKLFPNQDRISGLNLIEYYENWNEPNNDWSDSENYFSPYEFAAMCSADYDGHMQTLGNTVGIKNADPKAKMVMGGLASFNIDYLRSLKFWSDYNRNGSIPFDVLNFHHYSNNRNKPDGKFISGISPEEDSLKEKLIKVIEYRDNEMPGKEVWFTEFGYDTHPNSPQRAPKIGSMSQEEVQAIWLVRSFLAIAAAKVDKASMFMLRDVNPDNSTKYQTSGLTSNKASGFKPKTSWFYIHTLKNRLSGMYFEKEIQSSKDVLVYKFKHINKKEDAYVIWSPTSVDKILKNYNFKTDQKLNNNKIELITFVDDKMEGESQFLSLNGNSIRITVSEKPQIIKVKY